MSPTDDPCVSAVLLLDPMSVGIQSVRLHHKYYEMIYITSSPYRMLTFKYCPQTYYLAGRTGVECRRIYFKIIFIKSGPVMHFQEILFYFSMVSGPVRLNIFVVYSYMYVCMPAPEVDGTHCRGDDTAVRSHCSCRLCR